MALNELREELSSIYDVTIGYSETLRPGRNGLAPDMFEFFGSPSDNKTVHIHIKRYDIDGIPTFDEQVKTWLYKRFIEKDK